MWPRSAATARRTCADRAPGQIFSQNRCLLSASCLNREGRMARIAAVKKEELTARQQQVYDDIMRSRPRSSLTGPFSVWIHTPDIAEHADRLVNCFRVAPKLDRRLIELIILMLCRDATAKYAWSVHEPLALKEGLTQETIDAIRARQRPDFKRDDERLIYDFVT